MGITSFEYESPRITSWSGCEVYEDNEPDYDESRFPFRMSINENTVRLLDLIIIRGPRWSSPDYHHGLPIRTQQQRKPARLMLGLSPLAFFAFVAQVHASQFFANYELASTINWAGFNKSLGGRLKEATPFAKSCFLDASAETNSTHLSPRCAEIAAHNDAHRALVTCSCVNRSKVLQFIALIRLVHLRQRNGKHVKALEKDVFWTGRMQQTLVHLGLQQYAIKGVFPTTTWVPVYGR